MIYKEITTAVIYIDSHTRLKNKLLALACIDYTLFNQSRNYKFYQKILNYMF